MRLKIELPTTWRPQDNPDGPLTYVRQNSDGAFQISWAEYRGGKDLQMTPPSLEKLAQNFAQTNGNGAITSLSSGSCPYGLLRHRNLPYARQPAHPSLVYQRRTQLHPGHPHRLHPSPANRTSRGPPNRPLPRARPRRINMIRYAKPFIDQLYDKRHILLGFGHRRS